MTYEEVRALTDLELSERVWKALGLVQETRTRHGPSILYKLRSDDDNGWLGVPSACLSWIDFSYAEAQMRARGYHAHYITAWAYSYNGRFTPPVVRENPDHPQPELRARMEAMCLALMEEVLQVISPQQQRSRPPTKR